jgi:hypothetical protein
LVVGDLVVFGLEGDAHLQQLVLHLVQDLLYLGRYLPVVVV